MAHATWTKTGLSPAGNVRYRGALCHFNSETLATCCLRPVYPQTRSYSASFADVIAGHSRVSLRSPPYLSYLSTLLTVVFSRQEL